MSNSTSKARNEVCELIRLILYRRQAGNDIDDFIDDHVAGQIDMAINAIVHASAERSAEMVKEMMEPPHDWAKSADALKKSFEQARRSILLEADELINNERREDYGPVGTSFERAAVGWTVLLGHRVTPQQVALCMIWLKMCREIHKPKRDNRTDIAGYTGLLDVLAGGK